jgi:hypothetical protein
VIKIHRGLNGVRREKNPSWGILTPDSAAASKTSPNSLSQTRGKAVLIGLYSLLASVFYCNSFEAITRHIHDPLAWNVHTSSILQE